MRFDWSTSVFHNSTKHENDVSVDWLSPSCENLHFHEKLKLYIHASHIIFVFCKSENNEFLKEKKNMLTLWQNT